MIERATGSEGIAWLKESGKMPDLRVTWRESDAPGSMERHLKLLELLFGPAEPPHAA